MQTFPNSVIGRLQTYSYIVNADIPQQCHRKATDLQLYLPHRHFPSVTGRLQTYSYIFHTGISQVSHEGYRPTVIPSTPAFPKCHRKATELQLYLPHRHFPSVTGRLQTYSYIFHAGIPKQCCRNYATDLQLHRPCRHSPTVS